MERGEGEGDGEGGGGERGLRGETRVVVVACYISYPYSLHISK